MSLRDLNRRHVRLISLYWTRYAVRSGEPIVFLMIALLFGLGVTLGMLSSIEMARQRVAADGREMTRAEIVAVFVKSGRPIAQWALGVTPEPEQADPSQAGRQSRGGGMSIRGPSGPQADPWTTFLLDERPALLSAILLILLFGMPLLVPFIAFNQISGDAQSRGLRYVLLRTERANIFFGRFIGTAIFTVAVLAFVVATITLYLGLKIKIYPGGQLAAWGLHGFLALAILVVPYVALCSWFSASIDSPFLSLVSSSLVVSAVPLFAFFAGMKWEAAAYLKYLLPSGVQNYLLHPDLSHSLGAAGACAGYTLVFLFFGYRHFANRDL